MSLTPDEKNIPVNNMWPRERTSGAVYFPVEYVELIRKRARSVSKRYNEGENFGRDGAIDALYLASCIVETITPELSKTIFDISLALGDLNNGQVLEILKPSPTPKKSRPKSSKQTILTQVHIIVAMELYFKANGGKEASAKWAYKHIKDWQVPKSLKKITYKTIIGWRKAAKEGSKDELLTKAYYLFLDDFLDECGGDKVKLEKKAFEMLSLPPLFGKVIKK